MMTKTKTALITGCSSGYGLETARHFLAQGWRVVATMRTPREVGFPMSSKLQVLALDVTEPHSIARALDACGPIDVVVNNAGIGLFGAFEATPMATVREVFETNTFGVMALCQAVIPRFRARGAGTIVLAHVIFDLAFVSSVVRARLKSFDYSLVEASRDLGASGWTSFWRVTFPVILPAVVAGGLLAFTLSVDEFIIAFFTAGAGRSSITLPMQIYSMIRFGITPEINALATIVKAVSVIALAISQRLNKGMVGQ